LTLDQRHRDESVVEICKQGEERGNWIHEIEHAYVCKLALKQGQDINNPCNELYIQGKHSSPSEVEVCLRKRPQNLKNMHTQKV